MAQRTAQQLPIRQLSQRNENLQSPVFTQIPFVTGHDSFVLFFCLKNSPHLGITDRSFPGLVLKQPDCGLQLHSSKTRRNTDTQNHHHGLQGVLLSGGGGAHRQRLRFNSVCSWNDGTAAVGGGWDGSGGGYQREPRGVWVLMEKFCIFIMSRSVPGGHGVPGSCKVFPLVKTSKKCIELCYSSQLHLNLQRLQRKILKTIRDRTFISNLGGKYGEI